MTWICEVATTGSVKDLRNAQKKMEVVNGAAQCQEAQIREFEKLQEDVNASSNPAE